MTTCPQTLRAQRSTLAGMPTNTVDDLVRVTMDACEEVHDACLQAVQQALRAKRPAPPLNDWLAGASLCRTLAEVLAVEAPDLEGAAETAGQRQRLSPWAAGMAQLCVELCSELAARHAAGERQDDVAQALRRACEACVHACMRLLAEAGPTGGNALGASPELGGGVASLAARMQHLRQGPIPPQAPPLPAAA